METQINLPILNFPAQQTIFDSKARYKVVVKGRRFGLTKGKANDFMKKALEGSFTKGLWVDTINSNIDRYVERYFIPKLQLLPPSMWRWRQQARILHIKNSYIDFRSADKPENIEGFGYDDVFLNEAGIILKDEYLWNNAIRPMLWDYNSPATIGGTPKGMGLFHELAMRGQDPSQERYAYFHFTSFDNPFLDKENLRLEIADMPERVVEQEIYAKFLEDTGVVFRGVTAIATAQPMKPVPMHSYVIGIDLAKVQDFTVISVYDRKTNWQVYQDRFNQLDWPYQKLKIKEIADHYNKALCLIDATGVGDPIVDDLMRAGVAVEPIRLTNEIKKQIIEKLATWIEIGRINILNIPESIRELNSFTYDISGTGRVLYNAPAGFHDDIVISHALAVWGLTPLPARQVIKEKPLIKQIYEEQVRQAENDTAEDTEWAEWNAEI